MQNKLEIGFASSMFQTSGDLCGQSNWTEAAKNGTVPSPKQPKPHWENFEADLDLMKKTGVDTYRFSIEWSHIEPEQGKFDEAVIKRYEALIDGCINRGIKPMVTLFHFNEPLWFTKLGGFEREENIKHYTNFSKAMFNRFSSKVPLWCTINEPAVQAFMGYFLGKFPPHVSNNFTMTATVLKNFLKAHVDVYHELKALPNGDKAMIGIVHNVLKFKPLYDMDPIAYGISHTFNPFTDELLINFFKTGKFDYNVWFKSGVHYEDKRAPNSNDFFGLNFYANPVIGPNKDTIYGATCRTGQEMGEMYLAIDPVGFANAIDEVAELNKPIYITETGIADQRDTLRAKLISEYIDVVKQKVAAGTDVRGVYFWTPFDNYEWNEGNNKFFGFFDANRQPRKSLETLKGIISELKTGQSSVNELK